MYKIQPQKLLIRTKINPVYEYSYFCIAFFLKERYNEIGGDFHGVWKIT